MTNEQPDHDIEDRLSALEQQSHAFRVASDLADLKAMVGQLVDWSQRADQRFDAMDQRLDRMEATQRQHSATLAAHGERFDGIDRRLDTIDRRVDAIDVKVGLVADDVRTTAASVEDIRGRAAADERDGDHR